MIGTSVKREIGLFIVDNDPSVSTALRNFLELHFGDLLTISIFSSGAEALAAIDQKTEIIVLENYLTGETGADVTHSIKKRNRLIQVLRLGSDREIVDAIEIYSTGKSRTMLFEPGNRTFLTPVYKAITYPGRKLAKEFEVNEVLAVVLTSILFIGIVVGLWMALFSQ